MLSFVKKSPNFLWRNFSTVPNRIILVSKIAFVRFLSLFFSSLNRWVLIYFPFYVDLKLLVQPCHSPQARWIERQWILFVASFNVSGYYFKLLNFCSGSQTLRMFWIFCFLSVWESSLITALESPLKAHESWFFFLLPTGLFRSRQQPVSRMPCRLGRRLEPKKPSLAPIVPTQSQALTSEAINDLHSLSTHFKIPARPSPKAPRKNHQPPRFLVDLHCQL